MVNWEDLAIRDLNHVEIDTLRMVAGAVGREEGGGGEVSTPMGDVAVLRWTGYMPRR